MMERQDAFVLHGDVIFSQGPRELALHPGHYLVCEEGLVAGVFAELPERYAALPVQDHSGKLILPGFSDIHLHAPQFPFMALGMDMELLEWLEQKAFPEEAKYHSLDYARPAYQKFVKTMLEGPVTRGCAFATLHLPATLLLMDLLEESGLRFFAGKVNMDRNCPDMLREESAARSLADTREWLAACAGRYRRTRPILTPRFIPSCSDELLRGLAEIQAEQGLPVQSHLSENPAEVAWVRELCPEASCYADAYRRFGLLGSRETPAVMAHCVWPTEAEMALMQKHGVLVAHCPNSNANLASGIAPVRQYMEAGIAVGLGSDVAGGATACLFRVMADAIQHSKLRWRLVEGSGAPLTVPEAFYMATRGGGQLFGKVGAFKAGYAFDAVVLDDSRLDTFFPLTLSQRLERVVYLADAGDVREKYVQGRRVK